MNTDDPKFTAYALDELDPAERAEIEQLLRDNPAAAAELEATRTVAAQLRTRLQAERAEGLHPAQRAEVLASVATETPRNVIAFSRRAAAWSALAASVVIGVGLALLFPALNRAQKRGDLTQSRFPNAPVATITDASQVRVKLESPAEPPAGPEPMPSSAVVENSIEVKRSAPIAIAAKPVLPPVTSAPELPADRLELAMKKFDRTKTPSAMDAQDVLSFVAKDEPGTLSASDLAAGSTSNKDGIFVGGGTNGNLGGNERMSGYAGGINQAKNDPGSVPASVALNEARSRTIWKTDAAWANPVRKFNAAKEPTANGATSAPSEAAPQPVPGTVSVRGFNPMTKSEQAHFASNGQAGGYRVASAPTKAKAFYFSEGEDRTTKSELRPDRDRFERLADSATADPATAESYDDVTDNPFTKPTDAPLSTFSIDVDTASYANVRRILNGNTLPPRAAVRIEELVNYFHYDYPQPEGDTPFSSAMEIAACPWTPEHRLLRVALHGGDIARAARPASNLIFLIDVSGSMQPENKLPLLKRSLALMVDQLGERDQVGIVVYAGAAGCVLESTHSKDKIRNALDRLESGGSTHGSAGLQLAYELAEKHFIKGGTNRVILATDGDWNVGVTDKGDLWKMIERKAKGGVFLTVLGFGMDNLKDDMLEKLADKGNGNYAYIDTLNEGRKVLVDELGATLVTIAKDVKIQIEFNPAQVGAYRLIGYENRVMAAKDFADDTKDAGEIGAGHSVTAFYEIVPAGTPMPAPAVEPLKYQSAPVAEEKKSEIRNPKSEISDEMLTLKLRYKAPDGDVSTLREFPFKDSAHSFAQSTRDFRFAAAVAGYGMILRDSPHRGSANWALVHELAVEGKGEDRDGYRAEFVGLVEKARALSR